MSAPMSLAWVATAAGGTLRGVVSAHDVEVADVVTDTRTLGARDLFVALEGPRFDGHDFVGAAFDRGAAGAVVSRRWADSAGQDGTAPRGGVPLVVVDDTLRALQDLAHAVRAAVPTRVIAITGSAGKTTTKELTAAVLARRFTVVKNKGNLNNHIGLPLSLMQLRQAPDVAVLELGMNHAGEIRTLVGIAEPDVRVWTNVGDAHLGFFESSDAIADAKAEILERADASTLLVCPADDARITARRAHFPGRTVTFGEMAGADVRAVNVTERGVHGVTATIATRFGETTIESPLLGRANVANILAAVAVATEMGVPLDEARDGVGAVGPADRRGVVRRLRDDIVVVDDSYNSSPAALRQALATLAHTAGGRVAVLGEMLELGSHASALHAACGEVAARAGLRVLFAVGGEAARQLADGAVRAGMPASQVHHFSSSLDAAQPVAAALRSGDVVLVKGSRGTRCDLVVDDLVERLG